MNAQKKTLSLVLGGAFVATLAASPMAVATDNPFALTPLSSGYMVADHHEAGEKMQDGKCGAGTCGASMEEAEEKAVDGKCGANKGKEGSCSAEMKGKEGSCGAGKMKEGSCST